jgi:hypothetical protein
MLVKIINNILLHENPLGCYRRTDMTGRSIFRRELTGSKHVCSCRGPVHSCLVYFWKRGTKRNERDWRISENTPARANTHVRAR